MLKGELVAERSSWARQSERRGSSLLRVGARLTVLKGELVNED